MIFCKRWQVPIFDDSIARLIKFVLQLINEYVHGILVISHSGIQRQTHSYLHIEGGIVRKKITSKITNHFWLSSSWGKHHEDQQDHLLECTKHQKYICPTILYFVFPRSQGDKSCKLKDVPVIPVVFADYHQCWGSNTWNWILLWISFLNSLDQIP